MRSDRYLKKRRKIGNNAINVAKQQAIGAMMKNIAKIDWSTPYKDFIK
jgi:hypothetical protein